MRQLIVRATNAEGKVAQIAALTDDLERPAKEIVCQEIIRQQEIAQLETAHDPTSLTT